MPISGLRDKVRIRSTINVSSVDVLVNHMRNLPPAETYTPITESLEERKSMPVSGTPLHYRLVRC